MCIFLKHLEATGDKRLKGFNLRNDPDPKSSQQKVQQVIVDNQKISKAGKKIGLDGRTINTDGTSRKKRAVNFTQFETDELDFVVRIMKFLKENSKVRVGSLVRKQLKNNRICGSKYAIRSTALVLHVET